MERLDTRGGHVTPLPHHAALLGELRITSLRQDRHGLLWIGHRSGLIRVDPRTGALRQWGQGGEDAVPDSTSIDWLVEAPDNTLWLVSQMGSVQQRDLSMSSEGGRLRLLEPLMLDDAALTAGSAVLGGARAFASLVDFTNWSQTALNPGGIWMAMKGKHPGDELATLQTEAGAVDVFHVEQLQVPGLDAERCIVWMRPGSAAVA